MNGLGTSVAVRSASDSDFAAVGDVFEQSWRAAYLGIIPRPHLECLIAKRTPEWWRQALRGTDGTALIESAGVICGYATYGRRRGRGPGQGEIYELYIRPDHQGQGLGEHLFESCRSTLDRRDLSGLVVWALADNTLATDFYWRRGGRPFRRSYERFGTTRLEKIAFAWS